MSSSFKSTCKILELYSKEYAINKVLTNYQDYWAHTANQFTNTPETLEEHLDLVQNYLNKISKNHGLDEVIDYLIYKYLNEKEFYSSMLVNWVKKVFIHAIVYYDHEKINERLQSEKMRNFSFKQKENLKNRLKSQH